MSPGRAEAQAEDARSALTRRSARSYLRPDIAASHRARPSFHSRESTSVPSRLSSAAPPLPVEPTGLNPPTPVSGEPEIAAQTILDYPARAGVNPARISNTRREATTRQAKDGDEAQVMPGSRTNLRFF